MYGKNKPAVHRNKKMEAKKEIDLGMVTGLMDKSYSLIYVDYNENLNDSPDVIQKCLEAKNCDALFESMDNGIMTTGKIMCMRLWRD